MDDKSRLQLQKMISANNVEDQTDLIRELKHSHMIQNDINNLLMLKHKYSGNQDKIHAEAMTDCGFLFTYYTDIYNKIRKDEIDLQIMNKFLNILRRIEDGELDQHEGSFIVGTILKELYVDSALKKAEKINNTNHEKDLEEKRQGINISWNKFKSLS